MNLDVAGDEHPDATATPEDPVSREAFGSANIPGSRVTMGQPAQLRSRPVEDTPPAAGAWSCLVLVLRISYTGSLKDCDGRGMMA